MKKNKIIIIGANEFQNQLILKAKERNLETHVFAWADGDIGEKTADYFYPISIVERDKILAVAREIEPCAVISIASDLAMLTVNYIANELNLIGNSMESTRLATNKFEMRCVFQKKNIPAPKFQLISAMDDIKKLDVMYPAIVKPTDRSGSRGITKIKGSSDLALAVQTAMESSFDKQVLVEEYAEGREFSVEYISEEGKHHFLAITEKFTTGEPHYIETAHLQPARINSEQEKKIKEIIPRALTALKIRNGASHSELKMDEDDNIKIIEIGGRMGGDCIGSDLVKISTGYDFVDMVIDVAMGIKLKFKRMQPSEIGMVKFIFNQQDYELLKSIRREHRENIVRISNLQEIDSRIITDSSVRYGYFVIKTGTIEEGLTLLGIG